MFEDTKGVIRSRKSKKNRQHNDQMFDDTKGVIRSRKFKKNRQHNDQMFEDTRYQKPLIEDEQTMKWSKV
jgi:hypothetical protein